jgi:hypothetical protein
VGAVFTLTAAVVGGLLLHSPATATAAHGEPAAAAALD